MRSLLNKNLTVVGLLTIMTLVFLGCEGTDSAQNRETDTQQSTYSKLTELEPAVEMTNPRTRETVNFWTETWNQPGQLAFVYLQNSDGKMIGYYVLDGPPVSMCVSLTPNFRIDNSTNGKVVTPAPGIDGVYRSSEDCSRYYGRDATNGAYIEFTVGMGINMLLYTEPLTNHPNVENLAPQGE